MRILVTGAAGFMGPHLLPVLLEAGHEVHALVRNSSVYDAPPGAEVLEVDLSQPLPADRLPELDAIVHLAQANVPFPDGANELYAVNTASTQQLLDYARCVGAKRFLYASSASVYGFGDHAFREDDELRVGDYYAVTKINAERLISAYREFFDTVVFRFVAPYGPGQRNRLVPALINRVREGRPVTLNDGGRPRMNPIYVDDVVRVILDALELEGHHVLNVAGDEVASIEELALHAGAAVGRKPLFETGSAPVAGDLVADTSRLHELLDVRPLTPLSQGIASAAVMAAEEVRG